MLLVGVRDPFWMRPLSYRCDMNVSISLISLHPMLLFDVFFAYFATFLSKGLVVSNLLLFKRISFDSRRVVHFDLSAHRIYFIQDFVVRHDFEVLVFQFKVTTALPTLQIVRLLVKRLEHRAL